MNKTNLIGRFTKDPEVRYSTSGTAVTRFTLAVNRKYTKEGEERQADFISCVAFGKTAEFISKYFNKGKQVGLCGRIQTGSYEKDGQRIYTTDVVVEDVYFCGSKGDAGGNGSVEGGFDAVDVSGDNELPF